MLDILNRYTHGYVALPIILSCFNKGLFSLLTREGPLSVEQIANKLDANEGYLKIALHMFESLSWIKKESNHYDVLLTSESYQSIKEIPENLLSLYKIPTEQIFKKYFYKKTLKKYLNFAKEYQNSELPLIAEFVQGSVIVPLLIGLKQLDPKNAFPLFSKVPDSLRKEIIAFFIKKNWIANTFNQIELTEAGRFMLERAYNMATSASYALMLSHISELIFGHPEKVFKKNSRGHELHVDRTLNVIASGFQHVRYFNDVSDIIITIFNKTPFDQQPKYIIDTGCGDGTLLKKIYDIICHQTERGKVLGQYPLRMIGVDFNHKSLRATEKNLQNIPHLTVHGDIGNPEKIIQDLKIAGISDPEYGLHIRSFLDHDRPYISPENISAVRERQAHSYSGVYVNAQGESISANEMVQSLVEHLQRWASINTKHGLLLLEVHCLTAAMVAARLDESESFHFDAYHALSKQYLVTAEVFLLSAAEAGLFPITEFSRKYPASLPYTRITLNYYEKRDYSIHYAKRSDLIELLKLEEACWPKHLCASIHELDRRLEQFSTGQFVVKKSDRIVGVVYTQKIQQIEPLKTSDFHNVIQFHHPEGTIIQLLGLNISPEMQNTGLGNQVREFVLRWASLKEGVTQVVGITRCKNYHENRHLTMEQYVQKHIATPGGVDPILRFHTSHGAKIQHIVTHYRLEDVDNQGAGILIEYDLYHLKKDSAIPVKKTEIKIEHHDGLEETIHEFIKKLIPEAYRSQYSISFALKDMGLDSLSLLELRTLINQKFNIALDPTFFFAYNTPKAIIEYLKNHVQPENIKTPTANQEHNDNHEAIAIIGIGCRFPGNINNSEEFWDFLKNSKNAITSVPQERQKYLNHSLTFGGFIHNVTDFDAEFFHIAPREAELMDPQQRILLEVAWEAFENAGISADQLLQSKTGVYIGQFSHDYEALINKNKNFQEIDAYYATGNSSAVSAGRLSYVLGLQGPALTINTACSSSLVAVHLACQSLRHGECTQAIAGGVNLILSPELNMAFSNAGMLSPEGKCKTFDADANGYVRSEGCGIVILKKLSQAITDNDKVYAVIRGSAINQDGKSNGLTAPNYLSQMDLLNEALKAAQISGKTISYIEAHGTGTSLGDPIELKAIAEILGANRDEQHKLALGSVKTNLGHTEAAAGIAGLIKTILMLRHKHIPALLHFSQLNPHFQPGNQVLSFPTQLMEWHTSAETPRRAGISSFGFSGTNAHVILEEFSTNSGENSQDSKSSYLFTLSAKTAKSLKSRVTDLLHWLKLNTSGSTKLANISYTLNKGRSHFAYRYAVIADDMAELIQKLQEFNDKNNHNTSTLQILTTEDIHELLMVSSEMEYRNKLHKIADFYNQGGDIDWQLFYKNQNLSRMDLPVYPFDRTTYWYDTYHHSSVTIKKHNAPKMPVKQVVDVEYGADGIVIVRMNDKENKNQLSYALLQNLEDEFDKISNHPEVKVIVLTGYESVFCLGGSEDVLLDIATNQVKYTDLSFLYRGLLDCSVPVISAIQGHAFGAGLAFGLYGDLVVMSEDHLYTANFMKYGFTPGVGSTMIMREKFSIPLATEMMWSAKEYTGKELKERGATIAFRKTSEEVFAEAMSLAQALAKKSKQALHIFKQNNSQILLEKLSGTIERELKMHSDIFAHPESSQTIRQYFNKIAMHSNEPEMAKIETDQYKPKITLNQTPPISSSQEVQSPHATMTNLLGIVSAKLHMREDKIDIHRSFKELGVDSISAVEIVGAINQTWGLSIEAAMIYDHPTIQQFSVFIENELNKQGIQVVPQEPVSTSFENQPKIHKKIALQKMPHWEAEKKNLVLTSHEPSKQNSVSELDIAIIGFSGRFPGAADVDAFWENISSGHSAITEIPSDRWSIPEFYDANPEAPNRSYCKWGGFLEDIAQFDPLFFGLSPAEAEQMDPQQRLFLQESWKVFEKSGYTTQALANMKCAVFVGASTGDYLNKIKASGLSTTAHFLIGSNSSILASRISYLLDLKGPSVAIDTACSSSLVAIHQACQSLWTQESELALAGGVTLLTTPEMHIMTSKGGMLSASGQCKTFDQSADGFVPSEGVGVVLLKPLKNALQDEDIIYGVIKGSAINQDGKTNGITAPSSKSQTDLQMDVYKRFNINPQTISYVEAHGTGTKLGDPIEVGALTRSFRAYTDKTEYCAIGSVKTNIGHALLSAGVASVIKVLLSLQHKKLAPTLHYQQRNEHIHFSSSPFYVCTELKDWVKFDNQPRRAAINSFGLSGTNAHLVIEEAPTESYESQSHKIKPAYLITLSGKTKQALKQRMTDLVEWLATHTAPLENMSYTLNERRNHFVNRVAIVVSSLEELAYSLKQMIQGVFLPNCFQQEKNTPFPREILLDENVLRIIHELRQNLTLEQYREKLSYLAEFYLQGYDVDWKALHIDESQRLVTLPTYPFAKEKYWLSENNALFTKVSSGILQIAAKLLKINIDHFDVQQKMSEYGMDSIVMTSFIQAVNHHYKLSIPVTILYEHTTFASFIEYLIEHYRNYFETDPTPPTSPNSKKKINSVADDIAIIGMSGIFPEADTLEEYWENLISEKCAIKEIPKDRWDWEQYYGDPFKSDGKTKVNQGGFVKDIKQFDAGFFHISPREAELLDPQQRIFLQIVYHAIEDAGYSPVSLAQLKTGVFVGVVSSDYAELLQKNNISEPGIMTGNTRTFIANRISYTFNFNGPSEAIDTACSSSLVAIHHAIQSIQHGDCEIAIAGGVNALITPTSYLAASKASMLAEDGICKTFDANANGYVRAEGFGAIILKSLAQAVADGDHIYGVIKGSAVNHGGHVNSLTVPNPNAQANVVVSAYQRSHIPINTISYIEVHGTGTPLGDPIEINGLKKAFKTLSGHTNTSLNHYFCGIGSVKPNIGHLESAAGIASVIKVLLAMKHQKIPGTIHFKHLNPNIDLTESPFYIIDKTQSWDHLCDEQGKQIPYRAGISAFGFGGVNAHLCIEEYIEVNSSNENHKPCYLMTLSAKEESALNQKIRALREWVSQQSMIHLESLSFTLNLGREQFKHRCAFVISSLDDLKASLSALVEGRSLDNCFRHSASENISDLEIQYAQSKQLDDYKQSLLCFAKCYANHYPIDFSLLYQEKFYKRIPSLPYYPFNKQSFWVNTNDPVVQPKPIKTPEAKDLLQETLWYLRTIFSEKLKLPAEQITFEATYEVFGVESLLGLEIIKRLEDDFGTLPKTLLFEKNTLSDLAQYFIKKYQSVVNQLFYPNSQALDMQVDTKIMTTKPLSVAQDEDIAIIGVSGIYPLSKNLEEFWENLKNGMDCVTEVPLERWNYKDYPLERDGEIKYFNKGGFIKDVDKFDPLFFNISPRDATLLDPQERLFLQSAWSTLEDAGYTREKLQRQVNNEVGVFVGVTYNFYPIHIAEEWFKGNRLPLDVQLFSIANRVSYFLNLNGPSYVIDTACSSSLGAIHLACESILRGECQMAMAGGVNLSLHPSKFHMLGSYNFLSEQGHCASFGANGSGYVPGEGVGAVLLKPLSLAIRDKDAIYGVIKSSSMNHGGKTSGYTVPNPNSQAELIKTTLKKAHIDPRTISYIEAHGTGTSLGDPIEMRGLQEAFEEFTEDKQFCAIGSVKSNIGHLESAAGISQLTKVLLQLKYRKIVPSLHAKELNPFIDFQQTPFYVQQELTDWVPTNGQPLRAGISSFGAGGTNIHVIVEEYHSTQEQYQNEAQHYLFLLSAHNSERLQDYATIFLNYLLNNPAISLTQLCYTLQTGREAMAARLAIFANSYQDLLLKLQSYVEDHHQKTNAVWIGESVVTSLSSGDEVKEWLKQFHYEKLAQSWINGMTIPWGRLYQGPLIPLSLPTYPFAKRTCWIASKPSELQMPERKVSDSPLDIADWLYSTTWEIKKHETNADDVKHQKWLIFSDHELGLHLQNYLTKDNCWYCFAGESFENIDNKIFYVNPHSIDDFSSLFSQIFSQQKIDGMILLSDFISVNQQEECSSLWFNLLKALSLHPVNNEIKLAFITRHSQVIKQNQKLDLWQHPLWSMVRIFAYENPNYQSLLLDLDAIKNLSRDAEIIVDEIKHYQQKDNHIAYRDHERYVQTLQKHEVRQQDATWLAPETALITGGLGGLGTELAKFLIQNGTQYLLLIGATELDESSHDANQKEKIEQLVALKKTGKTIRYVAADVRDKTKMQVVIAEAERVWQKPIQGVFHLAGITTDNLPIKQMSKTVFEEVLSIKLRGSLVLHELFEKTDLKCFVLFSSISSLPYFGIGGLSAYATANAFLNGLALHRRSMGLPAVSMGWGAWSEKGMSFKYKHNDFLEALGMSSIPLVDGMRMLKQILLENSANLAVFKMDWSQFLRLNPDAKPLRFFDHFAIKNTDLETQKYQAICDADQVNLILITILSQLLQVENHEIDPSVPFQNYGMDSILGLRFVTTICEHFPDTVSPMDLYRYPTLSQLVAYIVKNYQPKLLSQPLQVSENQKSHLYDEPIAIIGLSCRFPNVNDKSEYWELLSSGKNIISSFPEERWNLIKEADDVLTQDNLKTFKGGFLSGITQFDAGFFGITPREAVRMDPQQRLLFEVAYEAFADAGLSIDKLSGSLTGVFTSLYPNQLSYVQEIQSDLDALYIPTGNATSMASNRLSYLFDLKGPSITLDTACSSSLVALHLACLNLKNKLCDIALVGAANINLFPSISVLLSKAKMLSPSGQCKTFDASADGYVQGEGVGAIVLKPLSKALQDNDRVYAVIAGSAINQDGKTNGLTAPNGMQQEALLKTAYELSHLTTDKVSYVECHGTGTFLGDPIEVQALGEILGKNRQSQNPCWIASVKTNIGHLEPAAGIASIIKVALAMQYEKIPPHLNFSKPNPHILFDKYQFKIPLKEESWQRAQLPRVAGISGFGFGGTNAHIVLRDLYEEEIKLPAKNDHWEQEIFIVSAKNITALTQLIEKWCDYLERSPSQSLAQICYNLHLKSSHFALRIAIVVTSISDLKQHLLYLKNTAVDAWAMTNKLLFNVNKEKQQIQPSVEKSSALQIASDYVNRSVDWEKLESSRSYPFIDLPSYPWQHQSFWPEFKLKTSLNKSYPFSYQRISSPLSTKQFEFNFNTDVMPEIKDSFNFLHAGYYFEMLAVITSEVFQQPMFTVEDCRFSSPIFVPDHKTISVKVTLEERDHHRYHFQVYTQAQQDQWVLHAKGILNLRVESMQFRDSPESILSRCDKKYDADFFYKRLQTMTMPTGDSLRWATNCYLNNKEMICEFVTPKSAEKSSSFKMKVHPGIVDGCIQSLFMFLPDQISKPYIASYIKRFTYYDYKKSDVYLYTTMNHMDQNGKELVGDFYLMNVDGELLAICESLTMTQLSQNSQMGNIESEKVDITSLPLEMAKLRVKDFIVDKVAKIFSMQPQEINSDISLKEMGMDSLMAIMLSSHIESGLGLTYPMQSILKGPSVNEMVNRIFSQTSEPSDSLVNIWLPHINKMTQREIRLFCFPYGGSGASIYSDWQNQLPSFVEVCPIQLPGREDRLHESSILNLDHLIDLIIENVTPYLNFPFAFFGHSFGSLIAFELSRALRKKKLPLPKHLVVSAFPNPCIPTKSLHKVISELQTIDVNLFDLRNADVLTSLNEDKLNKISAIFSQHGLTEVSSNLMNPEFLKILLPIFSSDMTLVSHYQYKTEAPLNIPVTSFVGKQDTWVSYEDQLTWSQHTDDQYNICTFEGGHLFIRNSEIKKEVLKIISSILFECLDSSRSVLDI